MLGGSTMYDDAKVTILSIEDVEKRYSGSRRYTEIAEKAIDAVNMGPGFNFALIEDEAFFGGAGYRGELVFRCNVALEKAFPDCTIAKLLSIIDDSELSENKLYISCLVMK